MPTPHAREVTSSSAQRLYKVSKTTVVKAWGPSVFAQLGGTFRSALVAKELMYVVSTQDESIAAELRAALAMDLWLLLGDDEDLL